MTRTTTTKSVANAGSLIETLETRRLMSPTPYPAGAGDQPQRLVGTADFNADGQKDLVWQNHQTNEIYVEVVTDINKPTPTYTKHSLGFVTDPNLHAEAIADWNGDASKPDLMLFNYETRMPEQWLVDGMQVVEKRPFKTQPLAPGWRIEGAGNFDGDHDASDLVWRNYLTNKVGIWRISYDMPYQWWIFDGPKNPNWAIEGAGDFDGDRHPDLVWRNFKNGKQCIWYLGNEGHKSVVKNVQMMDAWPRPTPAWDLEAIGDFNSDMHQDLLYRNYETGEVVAWLMNDGTLRIGERTLMTRAA